MILSRAKYMLLLLLPFSLFGNEELTRAGYTYIEHTLRPITRPSNEHRVTYLTFHSKMAHRLTGLATYQRPI